MNRAVLVVSFTTFGCGSTTSAVTDSGVETSPTPTVLPETTPSTPFLGSTPTGTLTDEVTFTLDLACWVELDGDPQTISQQETDAFVACVLEAFGEAAAEALGTMRADVATVPWEAEWVVGARFEGWTGDWIAMIGVANVAGGGYPNMILIFPAEVGTHYSRVGRFWPIYSDLSKEVWTAVPLVGTYGSITVDAVDDAGVLGTFEFVGSEDGSVPPDRWWTFTNGTFDAALLLDLTVAD